VLRNILTFNSNFPESSEYNYPKGYAIANFLHTELLKAKFKVQPPDNYDDFAWSVDCEINGKRIFFFVGYLGTKITDWQLIICSSSGILGRLLGHRNDKERTELAKAIHAILSGNERFNNLRWFSRYTDSLTDQWYPEPC
jgi:hypothetical protein